MKRQSLYSMIIALALAGCGRDEFKVKAGNEDTKPQEKTQTYSSQILTFPKLKHRVVIDGNTAYVERPTIEEITERGYRLMPESSASSVEDARVILFGDIHGDMNKISLETAAATVGRDDKVLLEFDPKNMPVFTYGTLTSFVDQRYVHLISPDFLERSEIKSALQDQEKILRSYAEPNFFYYTVRNGCGQPKFIDTNTELRGQTNRHLVLLSTLCSVISQLEKGGTLHPFEEFVLGKDLGMDELQVKDKEYVKSFYENVEKEMVHINRKRHNVMVQNIDFEITTLQSDQKAILMIGRAHLTKFDRSLLKQVEATGLAYLFFAPSHEPLEDISARYFSALLPQYFDSLKKRNLSYTGTLEGMSERVCHQKD